MKRTLFILASIIALVGCTCDPDHGCYPEKQQLANVSAVTVPGLEECIMTQMYPGDRRNSIIVIRCPLSAVSVDQPNGKSRQTVVTIDGVEYVKKEKQ